MVLFQRLRTTILFLILQIAQHGRLPPRPALSSYRRRALLVRCHRHLIYVHLDMRVGELGPLLRGIIARGWVLSGLPAPFFPHHSGAALQLELELLDSHRLHMVAVRDDDGGGLAALEGGLQNLRLESCWVVVGWACLAFNTMRAATLQS